MNPALLVLSSSTLVHLSPVDLVIIVFYFALVLAIGLYLKAEFGYLSFKTLQPFGDGLEGQFDLAALEAESLKFLFGDLGLREETLGFAVETSESCCRLCLFVPSLGDALDELHRGAPILFRLLLG